MDVSLDAHEPPFHPGQVISAHERGKVGVWSLTVAPGCRPGPGPPPSEARLVSQADREDLFKDLLLR
jgi:hypothetical protein